MTVINTQNVDSVDQPLLVDQLNVRWLGRASYEEVWDLQQALFAQQQNYLLLVEHDPVFTLGTRGKEENLLHPPEAMPAPVVRTNRGGDVTFHGPGQLVVYPILSVPTKRGGGMVDTVGYVTSVEQIIIDSLATLGLESERLSRQPGVWLEPSTGRARKVAAVGVRLSRGRSMHGFAINVDVDLDWFSHIVPCGISDKSVTSLAAEGFDVSVRELADIVVSTAAAKLAPGAKTSRHDVVWRHSASDLTPFSRGLGPGDSVSVSPPSVTAPVETKPAPNKDPEVAVQVRSRLEGRLDEAGVTSGLQISSRKPEWMKVKLQTGKKYMELKSLARELDLVTVCEEAGCPNIFDCWNEGTATFMLLGDRCTRKCGFCLIDTRKPLPVDQGEPARIAKAVGDLQLNFAVLTMVARDDLDDGGSAIVAETVRAIKAAAPEVGVEVLISDLKGDETSLNVVCDAQPDILNHNIETVARLQRAVRPSASYVRSLTLLARAKAAGMTTKSGLMVGMGETNEEVEATLADLAAVGVDIVTIGQYLRPTSNHLAINRWVTPEEFEQYKKVAEQRYNIGHVESSPLTRSSHHAGSVAENVVSA